MKQVLFGLFLLMAASVGTSQANASTLEKGSYTAGRFKFGPYTVTSMSGSVTKELDLEGKTIKRVVIQTGGSGGKFETRIVKCDGSVDDVDSLSNLTLYANSKAEQKMDPTVCGTELVIDHTPNMYSEFTVYVDAQ